MTLYAVKYMKNVIVPLSNVPEDLDINETLVLVRTEKGEEVLKSFYVCPKVAERYNAEDENGKNIGNNYVNIDVRRVLRWIGLKTAVKVEGRSKSITVYGFHSLRHSFASHCAEAGVPKAVVQSILGDNCDILDAYYTHIGDEAQQKAIEAISGTVGVITPQERIKRTIEYIDTLPDSPEYQKIRELLTCETQ